MFVLFCHYAARVFITRAAPFSKCKSSARRSAKAEVRGANPRGSTISIAAPAPMRSPLRGFYRALPRQAFLRASAGRRIQFSNEEEAVAVAQESEFLVVDQKIQVRIPAATHFTTLP